MMDDMERHPNFPALVLLASVVAGLGFAPQVSSTAEIAAGEKDGVRKEQAYSVQMHLHAHSNHNGSRKPASMQWHTWFAREYATDVLWWSEHTTIFTMIDTLTIDPSLGEISEDGLSLQGLPPGRRDKGTSRLTAEVIGGHGRAWFQDAWLYSEFQSEESSDHWGRLSYRPQGTRKKVRTSSFARPLSGVPVIELDIDLDETSGDARTYVRVLLAWHHTDRPVQYEIVYRLVGPEQERSAVVESSGAVEVRLPVRPGLSTVRLDLLRDSILLPDGDDGTISEIEWGVEARNGARSRIGIGAVRILSENGALPHSYRSAQAIADRYEEEYSVIQEIGGEYTLPGWHLNAFYPDSSMSPARFQLDDLDKPIGDWVAGVHELGGLVSLNHPFGATMKGLPENGASGGRHRAEALAGSIARDGGYGADYLEVGYVSRGYVGLGEHLYLWDRLTSSGLYLYGNGTTDSHGSEWYTEKNRNYFQTWVWAGELSAEALIEGLRAGRAYFGLGKDWQGEFNFTLGPYRMGDRVAYSESELDLEINLSPRPPDSTIRLVIGRIGGKSNEVEYVIQSDADGPLSGTTIQLPGPCFVRLEVHAPDESEEGKKVPILLSNPIVLMP